MSSYYFFYKVTTIITPLHWRSRDFYLAGMGWTLHPLPKKRNFADVGRRDSKKRMRSFWLKRHPTRLHDQRRSDASDSESSTDRAESFF